MLSTDKANLASLLSANIINNDDTFTSHRRAMAKPSFIHTTLHSLDDV